MLSTQFTLDAGHAASVSQDKLVSLSSSHSGGQYGNVHITEVSSGLRERSITLTADDNSEFDKVVKLGKNVLAYDTRNGHFAAYDLERNCQIAKLRFGKPITHLCITKDVEDMFLFVCPEENVIYGGRLTDHHIVITKPNKLNNVLPDFSSKKNSSIRSIECHPNKPYVFVIGDSMAVQIWSYASLRKAMNRYTGYRPSSSTISSLDESAYSDDGMGTLDGDDDETGSVVSEGTGSVISSHAGGSRRTMAFSRGKSPKQRLLKATGVLAAATQDGTNFPVQICCDFAGRMAAVLWKDGAVAVYNIGGSSIANALAVSASHVGGNGSHSAERVARIKPLSVSSGQALPTGWRPGKLCFHPYMPILFQVIKRLPSSAVLPGQPTIIPTTYATQQCPVIIARSLLEPSMRLIGYSVIEKTTINQNGNVRNVLVPHELTACAHSGLLVTVSHVSPPIRKPMYHRADSNRFGCVLDVAGRSVLVEAYDVCAKWSSSLGCGIGKFIGAPLSTPPHAFIEGDIVLSESASGKRSGDPSTWPMPAYLKTDTEIADSGLRPLRCNHQVYRMPLTCASGNKSAAQYMGSIPACANTAVVSEDIHVVVGRKRSASDATKVGSAALSGEAFMILQDDSIAPEGPFVATGMKTTDQSGFNTTDVSGLEWMSLIKGNTLAPRVEAGSKASPTVLDHLPTVYVMQYRSSEKRTATQSEPGGKSDGMFTSYKDAAFWLTSAPGTGMLGQAKDDIALLGISSSGTRIDLLTREAKHKGMFCRTSAWDLPYTVSSLWTSPVDSYLPMTAYVVQENQRFNSGGSAYKKSHAFGIDRQHTERIVVPPAGQPVPSEAKPSAGFIRSSGGSFAASFGGNGVGMNASLGGMFALAPAGSPSMSLQPHESVLELIWQPLPRKSTSVEQVSHMWKTYAPAFVYDKHDDGTGVSADEYPLMGVLTNQRVMIVRVSNGQLTTLNSCYHSDAKPADLSSIQSKKMWHGSASSIAWIGCALSYAMTGSETNISYLLPQNLLSPLMNYSPADDSVKTAIAFTEARLRASGLTSMDMQGGRLCLLPRSQTSCRAVQILSCLPDRTIIGCMASDIHTSYSTQSGYADGGLSVISRPCILAEPFILGLLSLQPPTSSSQQEQPSERYLTWVSAVVKSVLMYYPPRGATDSTASSQAGNVIPPSAHATECVCIALAASFSRSVGATQISAKTAVDDFTGASAAAALCLSLWTAGASTYANEARREFPLYRWIPPGMRFQMSSHVSSVSAAVSDDMIIAACADLFAERPDLLELVIDPESFGGGSVPHARSALASQCNAAANLLLFESSMNPSSASFCIERARLLSEIAGNDLLICALLIADHKLTKSASRLQDIEALGESLSERNPHLQTLLSLYLAEANSLKVDEEGYVEMMLSLMLKKVPVRPQVSALLLKALRGSGRRPSLQMLSEPLSKSLFVESSGVDTNGKVGKGSSAADVMKFLSAQQARLLQYRQSSGLNRYGPATCLGELAQDIIEDWIGTRTYPETMQTQQVEGGLFDRPMFGTGLHSGTGNDAEEDDGVKKPATWIEDVGQGKEWDKVVAYWRFSDSSRLGEPGFVCTGLPGTRVAFANLCKYGAPSLELYAIQENAFSLDTTTSPVDPGEDHEKVKSLCDVIYAHVLAASNLTRQGSGGDGHMSGRGLRAVIGRGSPLDIGVYHTQVERSKMTLEMWVKFDPSTSEGPSNPSKSATVFPHILMQRVVGGPSHAKYESGFDIATPATVWTLGIDDDGFLCWAFGGADKSATIKSSEAAVQVKGSVEFPSWVHVAAIIDSSSSSNTGAVNVLLYVNGVQTAKSAGYAPTLSDDQLAISTLYIGPDLQAGWHLTEVRVWADARASIDIESQRDCHLALASKRKRLQFRIKGGKKMFTKLSPNIKMIGASAANTDVMEIQTVLAMAGKEEEEAPASAAASAIGGKGAGKGGLLAGPVGKGGLLPAKGSALSGPAAIGVPLPGMVNGPAKGGLGAPPAGARRTSVMPASRQQSTPAQSSDETKSAGADQTSPRPDTKSISPEGVPGSNAGDASGGAGMSAAARRRLTMKSKTPAGPTPTKTPSAATSLFGGVPGSTETATNPTESSTPAATTTATATDPPDASNSAPFAANFEANFEGAAAATPAFQTNFEASFGETNGAGEWAAFGSTDNQTTPAIVDDVVTEKEPIPMESIEESVDENPVPTSESNADSEVGGEAEKCADEEIEAIDEKRIADEESSSPAAEAISPTSRMISSSPPLPQVSPRKGSSSPRLPRLGSASPHRMSSPSPMVTSPGAGHGGSSPSLSLTRSGSSASVSGEVLVSPKVRESVRRKVTESFHTHLDSDDDEDDK